MLALTSTLWRSLETAYGSAAELPERLAALTALDDDELSDLLWGHLCHQGDVYSATFAAAPYVWEAHKDCSELREAMMVIFCAMVASDSFEIDRLPAEVAQSYRAWRTRAAAEAAQRLATPCEDAAMVTGLAALVATDGPWPYLLAELATGSVGLPCACDASVDLLVEDGVLALADDQADLEPASDDELDDQARALIGLAASAGHPEVGDHVRTLAGRGSCPACGRSGWLLELYEDDEAGPD